MRRKLMMLVCGLMVFSLITVAMVSANGQKQVAAATKAKITIGFSQRRIAGSDWWKTLVRGAKLEAAKKGVNLIVLDANGDTVQQNQNIMTLIDRHVNAIIVNPNDPLGLAPSIKAAIRAGIPVIAVNCALDKSLQSKIYGYVVENQVATGAKAGYLMAPIVAKRNPGLKEATAVIIGGYPGDVLSRLRGDGFMQGYQKWLNEHPGKGVKLNYLPMQYGHWIPNDALPVMRDIATAHPNLKVVFDESDVMYAGVAQGLKDAGIWNNITMAEYDGYETTCKLMMDHPNGVIQVLATNEPLNQGMAAVDMAVRAVHGHKPEGTVYVDTVVFTAKNAHKYYNPKLVYVSATQQH